LECPNCKLINPPEALRCDCGYDFPTRSMNESYLTEKQKRENKVGKTAGVGAIMMIVITAVRHLLNSGHASSAVLVLAVVLGGCLYYSLSSDRDKPD
jgi:hypothetical protein